MKLIKARLATIIVILALAVGIAPIAITNPALADNSTQGTQSQICAGIGATGGDCGDTSGSTKTVNGLITTIVNIFSVVVGIVAVIMIIVAGFRFITSAGDSNGVAAARNTLMYALIGLIVVVLAQVIVHFVLGKVVGL